MKSRVVGLCVLDCRSLTRRGFEPDDGCSSTHRRNAGESFRRDCDDREKDLLVAVWNGYDERRG